MALTPEQKATNKAASKLRQAAHRARCKEFDEALNKIDVTALNNSAEEASAVMEQAIKARNDEADAIRRQIAELQDQLNAVAGKYESSISAAKAVRTAAYDARNEEQEKQIKQVEDAYPDITGDARYSMNLWVAPEGYIENFAKQSEEI